MSLDQGQVQQIATLARLRLDDGELADVVDKLSRIVNFVDQLQSTATDDISPMAHPLHRSRELRPDAVTERDERDRLQANAPAVQDGLYLVPKVIE